MDTVVAQPDPRADTGFDSQRISAAVDALAEKHAGREDVFLSERERLFIENGAPSTKAVLIPADDGKTVYDGAANVTWLANANLAAEMKFGVAGIVAEERGGLVANVAGVGHDR